MSKELRQKVYDKYKGHCAYCGKKIDLKDMQVDHLISKHSAEYGEVSWTEVENFNNYMPSCRRCNHYKRANSLETFRQMIEEIPKKLSERVYIFKVGLDYGLIKINSKKVKFFFEGWNDSKENWAKYGGPCHFEEVEDEKNK